MRVNNNKCLCIWHNIKIRYKQNEERCEIVLTITVRLLGSRGRERLYVFGDRGDRGHRFVMRRVCESVQNITARLREAKTQYQTARVRSKQLRSAIFGLWVEYVCE